jgi:serine/threonine protein kinase
MTIYNRILSEKPFPRIPKVYSDELNSIVHSMLNRYSENRPSADELLNMEYYKKAQEHFYSETNEDEVMNADPEGQEITNKKVKF